MTTNLFEMKTRMAELKSAIQDDAQWIADNAAKPETTIEELNKKKQHRDELQTRFDMLKQEHDDAEKLKKIAVEEQAVFEGMNDGDKNRAGKSAFYRAAILGRDVKDVVKDFAGLGAIPQNDTELGRGENLLPTNMETELIVEPTEDNSLRKIERVTNITGLEIPTVAFEIGEAELADVTDKDTAREIEMQGGKVAFGRFKTKVMAKVSDTVLLNTRTNLQSEIDNQLRSGLALKEKLTSFAMNPDAEHKHMSYYANGIKTVTGLTMYEAIVNAYSDLPDFFIENAKCVMRRSDYINMIKELANGSATLYGKQPSEVLGMPVEFNEYARIPVVGDFRFGHMNYEKGVIYDTDKDIKTGMYLFVVTAWYDHKIVLKSAFRLAAIGTPPTINGATITGTSKVGETLGVDVTYSSGNPTPNLAYQWKTAGTAGGSYTDIPGEVMPTYTPVEADVGKFIKVAVTANGSATGTILSGATSAVVAAG